MTKIKGSLNVSDDASLGTPLSKANGGTGSSSFPFVDSHSGASGGQTISSGTLADVTNSSATVAFPSNISRALIVINLEGQNAVSDRLRVAVDIDSGTLNEDISSFNAGTTGILCKYNGSQILDVSSFSGSSVTVKLQAARVFYNFTLQAVSWKILGF